MQHRRNDRMVQVSIRAPVRGATVFGADWGGWGRVSIRAPVRGATPRAETPRSKDKFHRRARKQVRCVGRTIG